MAANEQLLCDDCSKLNNLVLRGPDKVNGVGPTDVAAYLKLPFFKKSKNATGQPIDPQIPCYYGQTWGTILAQKHSCALCQIFCDLLEGEEDTQESLNRRVALRFVTKSGYTSDARNPWNKTDEQIEERHQSASNFRVEKQYGIAGLGVDLESKPGDGVISKVASCGLRVYKPAYLLDLDSQDEARSDALAQLDQACPCAEIETSISTKTIDLAKKWLSDCLETHSTDKVNHCDQTVSGKRPDDNSRNLLLPTRLIAVDPEGAPRLVASKGMLGRYLALSYRWGNVIEDTWRLKKQNLDQSLQQLPLSSLPSTIRDAIELTRRLGFEYLWVDSCCIVQDDSDDWAREAAMMQTVYQNATLTIAILGDRDSYSGFLGPRQPPPSIRIPWLNEKGEKVADISLSRTMRFQRPGNRDECMTDLEQELNGTPWSTRGWTFQELMLSRRILYVGEHQFFFECRKKKYSESGLDQTLKTLSRKQAFIDALDTDLFTSISNYLKDPESKGTSPWMSKILTKAHDPVMKIQRKYLKLDIAQFKINVDGLLYDYTSRNLTYQSDKLIAFEGLAKAIAARSDQEFHAGLWTNKVAKSLFWWLFNGPENLSQSLRAPTWSWASRDGVIKGYDTELLTNDDMKIERKHFDRGAFDGALKDVQILHSNFLVAEEQEANRISLQLKALCFKTPCSTEPASQFPLTWDQLQRDVRLWSSANSSWNAKDCHLLFAPVDDAVGPKGWLRKKARGELRRCPQCHRVFGELDDHTALSHMERCLKNEPVEEPPNPVSLMSLVGVAYFDEPRDIPSSFEVVLLWRARSFNTYYQNVTLWSELYRKGAEGMTLTGFYPDRYGWTELKRSEEKILGLEGRDVYFAMDDVGSGALMIKPTNPRFYFCLLVEPTQVEGTYKRCGVALAYWINGASGSGGLPLHLNCVEKELILV